MKGSGLGNFDFVVSAEGDLVGKEIVAQIIVWPAPGLNLDKLSVDVFRIGRQLELGNDIFGSKTNDGVGWNEIAGGFIGGDGVF